MKSTLSTFIFCCHDIISLYVSSCHDVTAFKKLDITDLLKKGYVDLKFYRKVQAKSNSTFEFNCVSKSLTRKKLIVNLFRFSLNDIDRPYMLD